jgi:hypothetical protein
MTITRPCDGVKHRKGRAPESLSGIFRVNFSDKAGPFPVKVDLRKRPARIAHRMSGVDIDLVFVLSP